ncbi:MAG TPA: hypothetical protein VH349_15460 [Ktedonobacterales bacterium]
MIVLALAGRRIDADGAPPRFPLKQAPSVKGRLTRLLRDLQPDALVCSAACGADLLALEAAMALNIPVTIVLPFAPEQFRETSVVDRPGDWGRRYDAVMKRATNGATAGCIHVIEPPSGQDDDVYVAATDAILDDAQKLAGEVGGSSDETELVAVVVWEGASRGEGDLTEYFRQGALERGFTEKVILTRRREPSPAAASRQRRASRKK